MKDKTYNDRKKLGQDNETIAQKLHKDDVAHKIGDMIERAGEKVKNAGAEKLGNAIYRAGNKIEHMSDNKKR